MHRKLIAEDNYGNGRVQMISELSIELIKKHEGLRLTPYKDTEGVWTVGYGHNLEASDGWDEWKKKLDEDIFDYEAIILLEHDLRRVRTDLETIPFRGIYLALVRAGDVVRIAVMENMMFNLGRSRFAGFKKFLKAMDACDYESAAKEMLDSKWAVQVKGRAIELAEMIKTGGQHG